ncbi:hypothetical protein BH23VER1_BH23VER1_33660 [soil metagenome]
MTPHRPLPALILALILAFTFVAAAETLMAQEGAGEVGEVEEARPEETLYSMLRKGGPVMIPLALCSLAALGIGIERLISLRRRSVVPEEFMPRLLNELRNPAEGTGPAIRYCEDSGTPVGRIFRAGLIHLESGDLVLVEKALEDAGGREVSKLKRSLRWLAIIATISPLLGLLGTVYGMIGAFQTATSVGMGKAEMLAQGIYEALVTTAAGLTIAIPVLLFYQYLLSRIDARIDVIDGMADEFLEFARRWKTGERIGGGRA